jgi:hypothetical protein
MKSAADRYRDVDLFTVDVEGENNTELTNNADVATESPVRLDIHPGEANTEGFDLGEISSNEEFGVSEGANLTVDALEDRHGNEIPRAKLNITLDGAVTREGRAGVWTRTDGTGRQTVKNGGDIHAPVGVFDLSVEVLNVPGPATQSDNTGDSVTETALDVAIVPENVTVSTTTSHDDFDVGGNETIAVAVDLGVASDDVDRVDVLLRRESGNGSVTFGSGGTPTTTDLWEESGYAGDDHLGQGNAWAIERNLTASDFDGGIRRYVVDASVADRYRISAEVMPREAVLIPNATDIETSLAEDPNGKNRDGVEITATGAIDAVGVVSVRRDREFVGTDVNEGEDVELELGDFVDASGHAVTDTNETVPVRFGGKEVAVVGPTGGESVTITVDPTVVDAENVEMGATANVTVELAEGNQHNGSGLMLVHRAIEHADGTWRGGSLSQPATLHVDAEGRRDMVQWNAQNDTYEGLAVNASGDRLESARIGHEQLHRGFYAYAASGALRIGFEYDTNAAETIETEKLELESGWHLASSNYDVSAHRNRSLEADLNWEEQGFDDSFTVWNGNRTRRIHDKTDGIDINGSTEPVGHDEVYWIEMESETGVLARVVGAPSFSETDGVQS